MGVRKFVVFGMVFLGCLLGIRKIDGDILKLCLVIENQWVDIFNKKLFVMFNIFEIKFFGVKFFYVDMYNFFFGFVNNFQVFGKYVI